MARFALFGSSEQPATPPSSSSSSSSTSLGSLQQSPATIGQSVDAAAATSADRRITSSNPSITEPESSNLKLDQIGCQSQSMRASHSDTNLMERFRKGNFVATFVGVRKSFSLQKRKSRKDKNKSIKSSSELAVTNSAELPLSDTVSSQKSPTELVRFKAIPDAPEESGRDVPTEQAVEDQPNSASDYVLHSRSLSRQMAESTSQWNDANDAFESTASVSSLRSVKSKKSASGLRPHSNQQEQQQRPSSSSYEQSLKKSWLYPMTLMNCCLTRTDSLPDVYLDSIGTAAQPNCSNQANTSPGEEQQREESMLLDRRLPMVEAFGDDDVPFAEHLLDEQMLIQSLNDLFLRNASPNQMISINTHPRAQTDRQRAIYLEAAAAGNVELEREQEQVPFNFPPPPPSGDDEFQELRQILSNHSSEMTTFTHPNPNHLFPSSNYPLQLGRMFQALPVSVSRTQNVHDTNSSTQTEPWNHHSPNPHSITNTISNFLPYPPPALFRSQRHLRTYNNPVHTQIDYINCLVPDLKAIFSCSFYWGKMDRYEAERLLEGKPEGTFLLRDSAQEDHLFSVSFRRFDRSLHARIEQWKHRFSFDSHDPGVYSSPTITGLIGYYKNPGNCMYFEPMLFKPLNRPHVFSLQSLAKATICDMISYDTINDLPLPLPLKSELRQYHYSIKVRTKHFDEFTYHYQ